SPLRAGLWSLPEADADSRPEEALRAEWGLEASRVEPLAPFEHAFTHFTLEVAPWRIELRARPKTAFDRAATWLALEEIEGAALPSPIRKLLRSVVPA
ncbi:MAG TPA: NUDIX domain-containing protein, partial [Usitatibacter sp.]|nr:NUDIX domain-containing protein [Usitatibacter sp.]